MAFSSIQVRSNGQTEFVEITSDVRRIVSDTINHDSSGDGICVIYVPHTTCGVTINEAADPSVKKDMLKEFNKIVPFQDNYEHLEGNSAAHIKTSIVGSSVTIPIHNSQLTLGTWQGIYMCEFDGPRTRKVHISIAVSLK